MPELPVDAGSAVRDWTAEARHIFRFPLLPSRLAASRISRMNGARPVGFMNSGNLR